MSLLPSRYYKAKARGGGGGAQSSEDGIRGRGALELRASHTISYSVWTSRCEDGGGWGRPGQREGKVTGNI